ncbi:MAG: hypothetical protein R2854_21285 [Caldilineaceae bacterium]
MALTFGGAGAKYRWKRWRIASRSCRVIEPNWRIQAIANGDAIKPVTNQVYKIETTVTRRDGLMDHLRSPAYQGIVHHAYKPSGTDGTIYYITDRIIVRFKRQAEDNAIETLLARYGLRLLRKYSFRAKTYLLQVTDGSGANPVKIANRLAEEDSDEFGGSQHGQSAAAHVYSARSALCPPVASPCGRRS